MINPITYPSTAYEYIKCLDSYFGGADIYKNVPEANDCIVYLYNNI
jgi:hypothetical protein